MLESLVKSNNIQHMHESTVFNTVITGAVTVYSVQSGMEIVKNSIHTYVMGLISKARAFGTDSASIPSLLWLLAVSDTHCCVAAHFLVVSCPGCYLVSISVIIVCYM